MKTVVAGALGECVHVAGVANFLRLAEAAGWRTVFLGPAVSIERCLKLPPGASRSGGRLLPPDARNRRAAVRAICRGGQRAARSWGALCLWRHAPGGRARPSTGFLRARLRWQRAARSRAGLPERVKRPRHLPKPIFPKPRSSASTGNRPFP